MKIEKIEREVPTQTLPTRDWVGLLTHIVQAGFATGVVNNLAQSVSLRLDETDEIEAQLAWKTLEIWEYSTENSPTD